MGTVGSCHAGTSAGPMLFHQHLGRCLGIDQRKTALAVQMPLTFKLSKGSTVSPKAK
jgi:hypothetical protein